MKRSKRRGTVIFFPGCPKTLGLLEKGKFFFYLKKRYKKVLIFNKNFSEKSFQGMTDPIIGISYSAGAIDKIDFVSKFPKKFSFLVFIAPAGTREDVPSLLKHCFLFNWEMLKLIWHREFRIFWEFLKETLGRFFSHPIVSFREIEKIKNFHLYDEIICKIYGKIDFAFIFSANDSLLPIGNIPHFINGRFIVEDKSSGHMGFPEDPENYWSIFQEL
jgi:hypothetical protein